MVHAVTTTDLLLQEIAGKLDAIHDLLQHQEQSTEPKQPAPAKKTAAKKTASKRS